MFEACYPLRPRMRFTGAAGLLCLSAILTSLGSPVWAQPTPGEEITEDEGDEPTSDEGEEPEVPPPPPAKTIPKKVPPKALPPPAPPPGEEVTEDRDDDTPPGAEPSEEEDDEPSTTDAGTAVEPPPPPRPERSPPRTPELPPPEPAPAVVSEQDLLERIETRAQAVRGGDTAMADVELGLLEETRKSIGAPNVVLASGELIHESKLALDAGLHARAETLADAAVRLSPDMVAAHWMRVRAYTAGGWTRLGPIAGAFLQLVIAKYSSFRNLIEVASSLVLILGCAFLLTAIAFTAVQLFKYLRYPAHDLAERLPEFVSSAEVTILLVILMGMPLVLGLGPMPTLMMALVAVVGYQTRSERIVTFGLIGILGLAPGAIYLASPLVTFHGSLTDALATAAGEALAGDAERRVAELVGDDGDYATSVILAHRQRQRGDLVGAQARYRHALSVGGGSLAQNNLGVALFLLGREDAAKAAFDAALGYGDIAEPAINLSSIAIENGDFEIGKKFLERARKLDAALTDRYTRQEGSLPLKSKLLEAKVGQSLLWGRFFETGWPEGMAVTTELWRPIGQGTPPLAMPILAFVGIVLAGAMVRREDALSIPCPKCGCPASRRAAAQFCSQCHSVFLTAVAVEPALRHHKESEVRGYQRRRRLYERSLSILAGAGHFYAGRAISGVIRFLVFGACLSVILLEDRFHVHAWAMYIDQSAVTATTGFAIAVAAVTVLLSLRSGSEK